MEQLSYSSIPDAPTVRYLLGKYLIAAVLIFSLMMGVSIIFNPLPFLDFYYYNGRTIGLGSYHRELYLVVADVSVAPYPTTKPEKNDVPNPFKPVSKAKSQLGIFRYWSGDVISGGHKYVTYFFFPNWLPLLIIATVCSIFIYRKRRIFGSIIRKSPVG